MIFTSKTSEMASSDVERLERPPSESLPFQYSWRSQSRSTTPLFSNKLQSRLCKYCGMVVVKNDVEFVGKVCHPT